MLNFARTAALPIWRVWAPSLLRPGVWRWLLAGFAFAYLLACWGVLMFERRLSYQPDPMRTPPEAVRLSGVTERVITTPGGERLIAWQAKAKPGQPTLLYFHGNGNALTYRSGRMATFQAEGYGVLMIAYRGYSGSTGKPTNGQSRLSILHNREILLDSGVGYRVYDKSVVDD